MADFEVLEDDQVKINRFSRLNLRVKDLEMEIEQLRAKLQTCRDAAEELEMCMDSDGIMLGVGEAFFPVDDTLASEQLEKARGLAQDILDKRVAEEETIRSEMASLKSTLYAKFGLSINLEDK
jgi:chaperonin cofactor prefoldin